MVTPLPISQKLQLLSTIFLWSRLVSCTRWFLLLGLWIKSLSVTVQVSASRQCFPVVLFIVLYKLVLTFQSLDEILKFGHSNENLLAALSCGAVYTAAQGGS